MIPALAGIFKGPLAEAAAGLVPEDDPRPAIPGSDLGDPLALARLFDHYGAAHHPDVDRKASASVWAKWHFSVFALPALLAMLFTGWRLPVGLGRIGIVLTEDGRPEAVKLPHWDPEPVPEIDRIALAGEIFSEHLGPFVDAAAEAGEISRRVLWSNLGAGFEAGAGELESFLGADAPAARAARMLISAPSLPNFGKNPLHDAIRYLPRPDGTPVRTRRVCCLRYRHVGVPLCKACPLDSIPPRFRPKVPA